MSRRKQAFPVRVEGNRLHPSVESGPSCIQKSSELTSNKTLPDICDSSTPDDDVHNRPPNAVSSEESIVPSTVCDKPKTSLLSEESKASRFVHDEQNFAENETRQQDSLCSIKVESPVVLEENSAIIGACGDSSDVKEEDCCNVKETFCTFRVDEKKQSSSVVTSQEPEHQSHYTDHSCEEVETSAEICRGLNVRTSLVCKAGTEIKIIQNICTEKVQVQCVTNLAEITFEIHKKPQKQIGEFSHENNTAENIEQADNVEQVYCVQEHLESKETILQNIFPCDEANDKKSEPLTLSCMDSILDVKESSFSTSPVDERSQRERVVSSPEPDSNTILLDESELNVTGEGACVEESSHILPDAEVIVTDDIYDEPDTDVLADDEALPPIKVEPCIILKEEQEPLNISSCIDSSRDVKDEDLGAFPADEVKQSVDVINIQELKPLCISHGCASCSCNGIAENSETYSDSNVRSPLIRRVTRQSVRAEKQAAQNLTEPTKRTSKTAKKQCQKVVESFSDTEEEGHECVEPKNILGSEDSPLEAILPCVDIDLSLLKEGQEPVAISSCKSPVIQESTFPSFPDDKLSTSELKPVSLGHAAGHYGQESTESAVEEFRDLNVKTHSYRTRNRANQNNCAGNKELGSATKSKGNNVKTGWKRRQRTRGSRNRFRAFQAKEPNWVYSESEESRHQVILPCVDVDTSLLKEETEVPIISSHKDPASGTPESNLFILPGDEGKQFECKASTQSECTQLSCEEHGDKTEMSEDSSTSNFESHIPRSKSSRRMKPCVTDEEIRCMVDFTKESLEQREKKLQQIREAVYRKRALETEEQRQARLEKDKLRQRKRRAEETEEQREKRLLTMRLHKRIKRSMNSTSGVQKNFLDYYMEEMFKYPDTQEEQGSPLNMIVSIDPSWVVRTVEKQQFKCAVETEEQRRIRLEKDMLRQRKKRAEETPEQRAKRLETMRINKRIRRAMETEEQRHRRLEYSRERQLYRRLNETDDQRKERLEREKLRQREKRASESAEERALRLRAARERMRVRLSDSRKVTDMIENLLSSDSLSS